MVLEHPSPCKDLWDYTMLQGGFLSEDTARSIMAQATKAAHMCCQRGVFHRDIKMENLLVNLETLEVKLIDFGCGDLLRDSGYKHFCGGNGRRKLTVVPPDSEGYTGSLIKMATTAGRTALYMVPLQDELCLDPLPFSAEEFAKMPKADADFIMQNILPKMSEKGSVRETYETAIINFLQDFLQEIESCVLTSNIYSQHTEEVNLTIGYMGIIQTLDYESSPPCGTPVQQNQGPDMKCPDDVLRLLASRVDDSKDFKICVSRTDFYQRAMHTICHSLHVYVFSGGGEETDLSAWNDQIINCGFTGAIKPENKEAIIRSIVLHATLRLLPLLKQIRKGFEVYNFVDILENHSGLCQQFFVPGVVDDDDDDKADADFIMQNILPKMSEKGSVRETYETAIINFLQDFLQEIESCDLIGEIEKHLFEHRGHQRGKSPIYSLSNLEKGIFRTAGEVFSVSLNRTL
ncbi:serine threonine- kinase pim-2-like protein [Labeo rohita]|uniref:non-specific serine/threonine protein kinase n=1 Tax=Labeo rohita TaxID=84645 RepID=A0A498L521_LABRO|nr:serine threonine- kinase pim-2-like protein [Labeo rohita]